MQCPSCAAPVSWDQRFAQLSVCESCSAALVMDAGALAVAGTMSALAQTPGPFYVGGWGRLGKHTFQVVGRVRYGYERGYWDEWLLRSDKGDVWVSEDENNFTLTRMRKRKLPPGLLDKAVPGARLQLDLRPWHVDERGEAICEGGEGQLPFVVLPGEKTPFVDLRSGKDRFATIEVDDDEARFYLGQRLDIAEVAMDIPKSEHPAFQGVASSQRVEVADDRTVALGCYACAGPLPASEESSGILTCEFCGTDNDLAGTRQTCPGCATAFQVPAGDAAKMVICPSCSQQIDRSGARPGLLGVLANKKRPRIPFKIGQKGTLRGIEYVVTGHLRTTSEDFWGIYDSDELMLYSPKLGYRWLIMDNGHFALAEELDEMPPDIPLVRKGKFQFAGRTFRVLEAGESSTVSWVNGQLPYVARVGDTSTYTDAIAPPWMLSQEGTTSESELYLATYLPRQEVIDGFGLDPNELDRPSPAGACQPYPATPFWKQAYRLMGVVALFNLLFGVWASCSEGEELTSFTLSNGDYQSGEYLTDPFTVYSDEQILGFELHSPVDNGWMFAEAALIDEDGQVLAEFSAPIEYYHGYEGGESWSEGSRRHFVYAKAGPAGAHRLLVHGEAEHPVHLKITVREGVMLGRYSLVVGLIAGLWWLFAFVRRRNFESWRWEEEGLLSRISEHLEDD